MKRAALVLPFAFTLLAFQNCGQTNFSGSSTSATQNAATTSTSSSGSPTTILGSINLADVSQIVFSAGINTSLVGSYAFDSTITLNDSAGTFASAMKVTGPLAAVTLVSCNANGSNVDYGTLEAALESMKISTSESSSSPFPDFASMTLEFVMKDGTSHSYTIDNNTNGVSVSGVTLVDAKAVVQDLVSIAQQSTCAAKLPF